MEKIYEIIGKQFRGGITPSEESELNDWLKSDDNQAIYNDLRKVWELTGELSFDLRPDIDAEWSLFVKNRDNQPALRAKGKVIKLKTWISIAAAVLILAFGIFVLVKEPDTSDWVVVQSEDELIEVQLPDHSIVTLNSASTLKYPESFGTMSRNLELSGEAFFEVQKDKKPFIVQTEKIQTRVLGTSFNLRAYPDEDQIALSVVTGKVEFGGKKEKDKIVVTQNQGGLFNKKKKELVKQDTIDKSTTAWRRAELEFNNDYICDVIEKANDYYNVTFVADSSLDSLHFTGRLTDWSFVEFSEIVALSLKVEYSVVGDTIRFTPTK